MKKSRTPEIMADSAYVILTSKSKETNGNFFIDDEVLASIGDTDMTKYLCSPQNSEKDLAPDYMMWSQFYFNSKWDKHSKN